MTRSKVGLLSFEAEALAVVGGLWSWGAGAVPLPWCPVLGLQPWQEGEGVDHTDPGEAHLPLQSKLEISSVPAMFPLIEGL